MGNLDYNFHFQLPWRAQPLPTDMEAIEVVVDKAHGEVVPEELVAGAAGETLASRIIAIVFSIPMVCRQEAAEGGYAAPSEDVPVYAGSGDDLGG